VKLVAGAVVLEDIVTEKQTTLISADKVPKGIREYWINTNLTKVLYATNAKKQYRYSYLADYFVQDVASGKVEPLVVGQNRDIQYAVWNGHSKYVSFLFARVLKERLHSSR
jgi:dipeptidyl-peptidase-4